MSMICRIFDHQTPINSITHAKKPLKKTHAKVKTSPNPCLSTIS